MFGGLGMVLFEWFDCNILFEEVWLVDVVYVCIIVGEFLYGLVLYGMIIVLVFGSYFVGVMDEFFVEVVVCGLWVVVG